MTKPSSRVSVVILCHNQATNLPIILRSLQRQSVQAHQVVIADDHSNQPIERIAVANHCTYVRSERPRTLRQIGMRALARQQGTIAAKEDVILYVDGDTIPAPAVIEHALAHHQTKRDVAIKTPRLYHRTMQGQILGLPHRSTPVNPAAAFQAFYSDCFSIRRGTVLGIGGWDSEFTGWGEEDTDLAYRCQLAGIPLLFPSDRQCFSVHIDHPVNHAANFATLQHNAARFLRKFPQAAALRLEFLATMNVYLGSYGPSTGRPATMTSPPATSDKSISATLSHPWPASTRTTGALTSGPHTDQRCR